MADAVLSRRNGRPLRSAEEIFVRGIGWTGATLAATFTFLVLSLDFGPPRPLTVADWLRGAVAVAVIHSVSATAAVLCLHYVGQRKRETAVAARRRRDDLSVRIMGDGSRAEPDRGSVTPKRPAPHDRVD